MRTILNLMKVGKVKSPLSLYDKANDIGWSWNEAIKESGLIDAVGSGHCRGKLVMMKIDRNY
jgi:hypothetical protein